VFRDLGLRNEWRAAQLKVTASLTAPGRERAEFIRRRVLIDTRGWRDPGESAACLPILLEALWLQRKVRFIYKSQMHAAGERIVDTLGLVAKGSVWYLIARVEDQPRTYRVSRMESAEVTDDPGEPIDDFDLATYWGESASEFRDKLPRYYAEFAVGGSVMSWVRYRGWRLESEAAEGDIVRVRVRFDSEAEAVMFALSFGPNCEVLSPSELRDKVMESAQAMLERYRKTTSR